MRKPSAMTGGDFQGPNFRVSFVGNPSSMYCKSDELLCNRFDQSLGPYEE